MVLSDFVFDFDTSVTMPKEKFSLVHLRTLPRVENGASSKVINAPMCSIPMIVSRSIVVGEQ